MPPSNISFKDTVFAVTKAPIGWLKAMAFLNILDMLTPHATVPYRVRRAARTHGGTDCPGTKRLVKAG
jgi:hypothetical protein